MTDNRCPQCGADRWTVDENAPYCDHCDNSWHREATTDDDEPITREWWAEHVSKDSELVIRESTHLQLMLYCSSQGRVCLCADDDVDNDVTHPLPHIRTRGQLRQLLALLGYQEKETH